MRDVKEMCVNRMNQGIKGGSSEKCAEQSRIEDKYEEVSKLRSNCTNGVVLSRGMGMRSAERRKVNVLEISV